MVLVILEACTLWPVFKADICIFSKLFRALGVVHVQDAAYS